MATNRMPKVLLGEREINILIFLWRWKLVSNAALTCKKFFPNAGSRRGYNRLQELKREGLIEVRYDAKLQNFAWALSKKGFTAIREFLSPLREEGYKSENFEHDLLVTMFHLGDWLLEAPSDVRVFSEQELRRTAFPEYPWWVPKTTLHRPDGYTGFIKGDRDIVLAIEIECSRKKPLCYELVAGFYRDLTAVHRVLWLVPSTDRAKNIQTIFMQSARSRSTIHNFILIPDFMNRGWRSQIVVGPEAGQTVTEFYDLLPREKGVKSTGPFTTPLLLNTKRSFVRSKACENLSRGSMRY